MFGFGGPTCSLRLPDARLFGEIDVGGVLFAPLKRMVYDEERALAFDMELSIEVFTTKDISSDEPVAIDEIEENQFHILEFCPGNCLCRLIDYRFGRVTERFTEAALPVVEEVGESPAEMEPWVLSTVCGDITAKQFADAESSMLLEIVSESFEAPERVAPRAFKKVEEPSDDVVREVHVGVEQRTEQEQESDGEPPAGSLEPSPPARSRLFPRITVMLGGPVADPSPGLGPSRATIIVDQDMANMQDFRDVFHNCRIVRRQLKYVSAEINERTGVIMEAVKLDSLIAALCCFEIVYVINADDTSLCDLASHSAIRVRNFVSRTVAFRFLLSLASTAPNAYLRDKESLHENLLWLFPTVSRSLALHMLRNGNPITDVTFFMDPFPGLNTYTFKTLLDMPTMAFTANRAARRSYKKKSIPRTGSTSICKFIPGVTKVAAPQLKPTF